MKVVLDTNIFVRDYSLGSPPFVALHQGVKATDKTLCVPSVVLDEAVNKFREQYGKLHNDHSRMGISKIELGTEKSALPKVDEAVEGYDGHLRAWLSDADAKILEYPKTPHEELVERALRRKKPFRSSDTGGYRDVLVWFSILEELRANPKVPIALISKNPKDFSDPNEENNLHQDLIDDLVSEGFDQSSVSIFTSLSDFIDIHIKPSLEELSEIKAKLEQKSFPGLDLERFLTDSLIEYIGGNELEPHELGLPSEFETNYISMIEDVESIYDIDVRGLHDDDVLISFSSDTDTEVDTLIEKHNYYSLPEHLRPSIWSSDWNKWFMAGSSSAEVTMKVSLILDPETGELKSVNLDSVEPRREWWDIPENDESKEEDEESG